MLYGTSAILLVLLSTVLQGASPPKDNSGFLGVLPHIVILVGPCYSSVPALSVGTGCIGSLAPPARDTGCRLPYRKDYSVDTCKGTVSLATLLKVSMALRQPHRYQPRNLPEKWWKHLTFPGSEFHGSYGKCSLRWTACIPAEPGNLLPHTRSEAAASVL